VLNDYTLANDLDRQFGDVLVGLRKMIHGFALLGGPPRYEEQALPIGRLLGRNGFKLDAAFQWPLARTSPG
jgi:hypothetical protein